MQDSFVCRTSSGQLQRRLTAALLLALSTGHASAATGYLRHNLVADVAGVADFTDPLLVNPWGISFSATSPFWLCNAGSGTSTVYSSSNTPGAALGTPNATLKPAIPGAGGVGKGACTGTVANTVTTSFLFSTAAAPTPRAASFIFATEDGTISSWANAVDATKSVVVIDNSTTAYYKGLALVATPTPQLYAANFKTGAIDVFDGTYKPVTLAAGSFTDPAIPPGFAPFNIWPISGKLYVAYAKQDTAKKFDVAGLGNGYVSVYDTSGRLLQHLVDSGPLNSPWGMAIAPATFGVFANALLVGNFGDGKINAFDATTGAPLGALKDPLGNTIAVSGLWALVFGNGGNGGDRDALYFTAGTSNQTHGLFGSIQANPVVTSANITNSGQAAAGVASNTFITVKGSNLAATKRSWATADFVGNLLPGSLDGVTVTINGKPGYISFISPVQINLLTPVDLPLTGNLDIVVSNNTLTTTSLTLPAQSAAPAFFLINGDKYVAAKHSNNISIIGPTTLITNATTPAKSGEKIVIYANGFGATTPGISNGQIVITAVNLPVKPIVLVNNVAAVVDFAGVSASGLYQINITLPANLPDGDLPISAQLGALTTPAGALITIKN